LGRSSGKFSLACRNLWCERQPSIPTLCMLLGWQRICSRFYESKRLREKLFMRAGSKRNFSGVKYGKFIWPQREKEWIFHKGHQKEREMLCGSILWSRHLRSPLKTLLQALDGTAMWRFFLILWSGAA
jgi:hypothetical protein